MHRSISGEDQITRQEITVVADKIGNVRAADLLFTFEQYEHITGQFLLRRQERFDGEQLGEMLSLVITHTAGVDAPIPDGRFKGGRKPGVQRVGRLYVVVTIEQ